MLRARLAAAAASRMQQRGDGAKDAAAEPLTLKKQRGMRTAELLQEHGDLLASLTPEQLQQLRRAFLAFADHDTQLVPASQLGPLLRSVGDAPRLRDLQALHDALGVDDSVGGAGYVLDFAEFTLVLALRTRHLHTIEDVIAAFRVFDPDGTGTVSAAAFKDAMTQLTAAEDAADVEALMAEAAKISAAEDDRRKELKAARVAARAARAAAAASRVDGARATARPAVPPAMADIFAADSTAGADSGAGSGPGAGHVKLDMGIGPTSARRGAKAQTETYRPASAAIMTAATDTSPHLPSASACSPQRPRSGVKLGIGPSLATAAAALGGAQCSIAAAGSPEASAAATTAGPAAAGGSTSPVRAQRIYYELVARSMFSF